MNVFRFRPGPVLGDVLGADDRALDDQQVDALGEHVRRQVGGVLRAEPHRDPHAAAAQSATRRRKSSTNTVAAYTRCSVALSSSSFASSAAGSS